MLTHCLNDKQAPDIALKQTEVCLSLVPTVLVVFTFYIQNFLLCIFHDTEDYLW